MSKRKKVPNSHDGYAVTCKKQRTVPYLLSRKESTTMTFAKPLGSVMYSVF